MSAESRIRGRLVLADRVVAGEIAIEDGVIARIDVSPIETSPVDPSQIHDDPHAELGPILAPGYIDVHVHGWGGHSAMGGLDALDGMARSLLHRGVTSFLPTAVSAPLDVLADFADAVRGWSAVAPANGSGPLGFNLEGPFLAGSRKGAHDAAHLRAPADVPADRLEPLLDGLRVITIAPELPGAIDLIRRLAARGVRVSLGHSDATIAEAKAGYAAGATSTTHLFNAMSGVHHRDPGLAVAALVDDAAWVELIADGHHVDASLVPIVARTKPADRLLLVSDAIPAGGTVARRAVLGGLECEIDAGRVTLAGTTTLAGSVIALDDAVRFLAGAGIPLPAVVAAASSNPAALLGATDRGRLAVGLRADLVELGDDLRVRRVMRDGEWYATA